ncbi:hypothetical protein [Polaromonas sp. UC242_47]|uniref:hypothetical protein n=1 Tax=Polaromonas sp. UC242_47 TaxID=3374626 RepID=UPI0037AB069C
MADNIQSGQSLQPITKKIITAAIGAAVGLLLYYLFVLGPKNQAQQPPTSLQSAAVVREHNYDLKEGVDYGYTVLLTDDQRKAGKASAEIVMFSYAGQRDGKHQIHARQTSILTAYECAAPCEIIKVISAMDIDGLRKTVNVDRLRPSPNMIAALALQDAMTGKLEPYAEYQGKQRYGLWVDERQGIVRTALR